MKLRKVKSSAGSDRSNKPKRQKLEQPKKIRVSSQAWLGFFDYRLASPLRAVHIPMGQLEKERALFFPR